jgi:hypothetical protein
VRNHNEKTRDMARSVLPSTRRAWAREARRAIHHRERARLRSALAVARRDEPDDIEVDLAFVDRGARRDFVLDRRSGDKVAPVINWAVRTIAKSVDLRQLDPRDQLDHFRRVLPDNLIGRHAVSHLEWVLVDRAEWQARWAQRRPSDRFDEELASAVDRVLAAGAHGELNRALKHSYDTYWEPGDPRRVLLHGAHDRDRFIAALPAESRVVVLDVGRRCL